MQYCILGPLEVLNGGEPIDVGSRQQRALLAILLLHANRVVATDRILEDLWPGDPTGKERTLWVYVSRLRTVLDPDRQAGRKSTVIVTRDHGYSLSVAPDEIDAHRFEQLARQGAELLRDDPESAAAVLREALGLWRGSALEDFTYDDFVRADTARLDDLRLTALEDRIEADIRAGHHREVVGELEQLVAEHRDREGFVGQLMIALYRSGRQADALRAFERHRHAVGEELGIEPSPELRRIEEEVLLHDVRLAPPPSDDGLLVGAVNPFKGLQAFTEDDTSIFFGRDRLVADLVRRVTCGSRLVALIGASGSGKSSVLHAGLVAGIRKGAVGSADDWIIARMLPGARPFQEAEAALYHASIDAQDGLAEVLGDADDGLLRACLRLLPEPSSRMLLVIDQFEELFTLGASTSDRDRFIHNLEVVLDDPYGRVVVAIALRADFYGSPLAYPSFAQMLADGIVNVVPLTPDELESAAEEPAARVGTALEPTLLVHLLGDVAGQAGGLPLFQFALTELFDRRDGSTLTHAAYEDMGGVSGAIARRAEDVFLGLDGGERDAAKQLFLRLVTIVEQGAWARRRVAADEIAAISTGLVALQTVLDRFATHRLLTLDRDPVTNSPTVEVAHEALLHEWPRLRRWIEQGHHDLLTRARLSTAATEWEGSGRQAGYLLTGQRLADYEAWASTSSLRLSTAEQRFLDDSILQRESELLAEEKRLARESRLDRAARHRLWVLVAAAVAMVVGVVGAIVLSGGGGRPSIAVVHSAAGDRGATDLMIAGVGNAEREHDLTVDLIEPLIDAEADLRRLAEAGLDLVILDHNFDLDLNKVVLDYPDVAWVAIDPVTVKVEAANVTEMHFATEHSASLAGAAAALSSETGRIGFIGGHQTFGTERSRNGFEQGAAWADPEIEVVSAFMGPVVDPMVTIETRDDLAYELASAMYSDGIDVIFHDAGRAGSGVTRAANEAAATGRTVWTIGSDTDEFLTLPTSERGVVLSSTIKRFDTAVERAIASFLDGELAGGVTKLGLAEEGVALSRSGDHLHAIDGRLRNLEGEIQFPHITVSPHSVRPPVWQSAPDVLIEVTVTDDDCTVDRITRDDGTTASTEVADGVLPVARGAVVAVEFVNASSDIAPIFARVVPVGTTNADLEAEERMGSNPPRSAGAILGASAAQLGGRTGIAVAVAGSPISLTCSVGPPPLSSTNYYPLIVRPS